jgi:hypothetical protein
MMKNFFTERGGGTTLELLAIYQTRQHFSTTHFWSPAKNTHFKAEKNSTAKNRDNKLEFV